MTHGAEIDSALLRLQGVFSTRHQNIAAILFDTILYQDAAA